MTADRLAAESDPVPPLLRRGSRALLELAGWMLLAVATLGPAGAYHQRIPVGNESAATVPLFNLWTIGWNGAQLAAGLPDYWQAPIFHPQPGAFALSEAQPTTMIVAPVARLGTFALAYNIYLLLTLGLNGLFARRLLVDVGLHPAAATFGGVATLSLPFIHWQLGVLQLCCLWGPIGVLWGLLRFSRRPTWTTSLLLGVAAAATYAACNYYGLFLTLLAPACLLPIAQAFFAQRQMRPAEGNTRGALRLLAQLTLAVAAAAVIVSPILRAQMIWLLPWTHPRGLELVRSLSLIPTDYLHPAEDHFRIARHLRLAPMAGRELWPAGSGTLMLLWAAIGLVIGLCRRGLRKWTLFCLVAGLIAFAGSLGPRLQVAGFSPFVWMRDWYPGLAQIRSPFRLAVLVQLMLVFLAAGGLSWLWRRYPGRFWRAVVLLLMLLPVIESWPTRNEWHTVPSRAIHAGWIDWVRNETPPDAVLACLPIAIGNSVADFEETTVWMFLGLWHEREMVNGYSGFFPEHYMSMRKLMPDFPDETSVTRLRQLGVTHLVIRMEGISAGARERLETWHPLYVDQRAGVKVYALER
ncbi:MAG: hypothetical protein ACF8TS_21605 [Maioricimonas sp. JB049]